MTDVERRDRPRASSRCALIADAAVPIRLMGVAVLLLLSATTLIACGSSRSSGSSKGHPETSTTPPGEHASKGPFMTNGELARGFEPEFGSAISLQGGDPNSAPYSAACVGALDEEPRGVIRNCTVSWSVDPPMAMVYVIVMDDGVTGCWSGSLFQINGQSLDDLGWQATEYDELKGCLTE